MTILIDNYDSFTYNVFQYFSKLSSGPIRVVRNDEIDLAGLEAMMPDRLVISPGPGRPEDAGICVEAIRHFAGKIPILGICLGHQAIGYAFGGTIAPAKRICHGEAEEIDLDGKGLYRTVGTKSTFTRYHSLVISEKNFPPELEVSARSKDGDIMGVRHRKFDIEGVQFHPESIASTGGEALIKAFLEYRREAFGFRAALEKVVSGKDLERETAEAFMEELTSGSLDTAKTAAMLAALASKGPAAQEIAGCAAILQRKKRRFTPIDAETGLTDTCGTGGDGAGTFNISSMAALTAAACGLPIAKHGNRAISSRSGSADFYEALGFPVEVDPAVAAKLIERTNFAFFFAPQYHGAMRFAAPARKALGIKTIMNLVGPLANPAGAAYQVIGVYSEHLLEEVAKAARMLGVRHVLAVHSRDGLDEISPCALTDIVEIGEATPCARYVFDPFECGLGSSEAGELSGGDAEGNARQALELASGGGRGALRNAVALNAGAALYVAGRADSIESGARLAKEALASGKVLRKIEEIRNELGASASSEAGISGGEAKSA